MVAPRLPQAVPLSLQSEVEPSVGHACRQQALLEQANAATPELRPQVVGQGRLVQPHTHGANPPCRRFRRVLHKLEGLRLIRPPDGVRGSSYDNQSLVVYLIERRSFEINCNAVALYNTAVIAAFLSHVETCGQLGC